MTIRSQRFTAVAIADDDRIESLPAWSLSTEHVPTNSGVKAKEEASPRGENQTREREREREREAR